MGRLIDSITVFEDGITGGAFEAGAAADGDSLQVRWFGPSTRARILDWWGGNNASKMDVSIRSADMHDNTRGLAAAHMFNPTTSVADGNPQLYLGARMAQPLRQTETLVVEVNGTAADDYTTTILTYYEGPEVPVSSCKSWAEIESRIVNLVGIRVSPAPAAATSTYGTAEALNADDDRLHANTEYALIGYQTDLPFTTLAIDGPETANRRIAMPGHWDERITSGYFRDLSEDLGLPLIPCFNSNNKGGINLRAANAGGGGAPLIRLQFAELSGAPTL